MAAVIRIGQHWRRRVEQGDEWDNLLIVGVMQITEETSEWSLRPYPDGLDVVSASAASLEEAFTLVSNPASTPPPELGSDALGGWS